jgi:cell division cycle 2-like
VPFLWPSCSKGGSIIPCSPPCLILVCDLSHFRKVPVPTELHWIGVPSALRKRSKQPGSRESSNDVEDRPTKRVKLSEGHSKDTRSSLEASSTLHRSLTSRSAYVPPRIDHPPIQPARSVYAYERLNQIEEGTYGVVFRGRDKSTGGIVALKKLKLDEEKFGFPITALREINALMACRHENVVRIREVVVGDTLTQ